MKRNSHDYAWYSREVFGTDDVTLGSGCDLATLDFLDGLFWVGDFCVRSMVFGIVEQWGKTVFWGLWQFAFVESI